MFFSNVILQNHITPNDINGTVIFTQQNIRPSHKLIRGEAQINITQFYFMMYVRNLYF